MKSERGEDGVLKLTSPETSLAGQYVHNPNNGTLASYIDRIELSNLTRQFLFREINVGQPKSKAGCAMAVQMNRDLKVNALEHFVGRNTENIFDDEFWMQLDGVCNALDNMEARRYVDVQCVKYEKSLLESGTMGTKGNIQTILPYITSLYSDIEDSPIKEIPVCTIKNFPSNIDHCIQWALEIYNIIFIQCVEDYNNYVNFGYSFIDKIDN